MTTQDDEMYTPYDLMIKVGEEITPGAPNMADPANADAKPFTVGGYVYTKRSVYRHATNDLSDAARRTYVRLQQEFREKHGRDMDHDVAAIRAQLATGDLTKAQAKQLAWGLRKNRDIAIAKEVAKESADTKVDWKDYYVPTKREDVVDPKRSREGLLAYMNADSATVDPRQPYQSRYLSRRYGFVRSPTLGTWGEISPEAQAGGPAYPSTRLTGGVVTSPALDDYLGAIEIAEEARNLYRPFSGVREGPYGATPDRVRLSVDTTPRGDRRNRVVRASVEERPLLMRYPELEARKRAARDAVLPKTAGRPLGPAVRRAPYEGPSRWTRLWEPVRSLRNFISRGLPPTHYPHDWSAR